MKTIGWILIATSGKYGGGNNYGERLEEALAPEFQVEKKLIQAKYLSWRYFKPLEWMWRLYRLGEEKNLWIMHTSAVVTALPLMRIKGKKLAIIHHLDDLRVFPFVLRPFLFVLEKLFYRNLRNVDAIVTVSEYWKDHFLKRGYRHIFKIYNAFPVEKFQVSEDAVFAFKKKFQLEGKPIIYIGNCQKAKGVGESYEALKGLAAYFVTSGERRVIIPARHLDLDYQDYLALLKASAIVVTMSQFREGWCATAHEAMLLKTPVIGSGSGGMRELLEGGEQIICESFDSLKSKVEFLLSRPEEARRLGERGHEFARQFASERFAQEWQKVIRQTIG